MTDWPHTHTEMISSGRTLLIKRNAPWIFDATETLPPPVGLSSRVQIGDFAELGRGLVIDGTVQLTEVVDPIYTPALVFPAALLSVSRARWLIVGGGDGAAAREALRFADTESVHVIDLSRTVIEQTQALIPSFWGGCQHDPRLRIDIAEAGAVLRDRADTTSRQGAETGVDILLYDLSDPALQLSGCNPFEVSAADALYTEQAFQTAARCLRPGGLFVVQMAELSVASYHAHLQRRQILARAFRHVHSYAAHIEPFGYTESWILATNRPGSFDPLREVDIADRLSTLYRGDADALYSPAWHGHLFALPPPIARHFISQSIGA